jgi:hypothetical protein
MFDTHSLPYDTSAIDPKLTTNPLWYQVKKYGSLDNYLLNVRTKWLGERAMWLRSRIQDKLATKESQDRALLEIESGTSNQTALEAVNGLENRPRILKGKSIISELDLISERLAKSYPKSVSHHLGLILYCPSEVMADLVNRNR